MTKVPARWNCAALGDVCDVVGGGTPKTAVDAFWGGTIRWVTPNDMSKDRSQVLSGGERSLTVAGYAASGARLFPSGSIIVSSRAPVGYVAIAGEEMCTNQGCKTAVPPDDIDSRYLYWYLTFMRPDLEARASGTTFKEISKTRFAETVLIWPGIGEQRRIVDILEDHLSRIDAADSGLSHAIRRSVTLQESWLQSLPAGSEADRVGDWLTLGEVLTEVRGGWSRSSRHLVPREEGTAYLKMNNITRRGRLDTSQLVYVRADADARAKFGVLPGDVLFNSKNSGDLVGKTAVADSGVEGSVINENIMRLRFDDRVDPHFAALWFLGPLARRHIRDAASASTNVAAVYQKELVTFPIWVPRLDEQRRLQEEFEGVRVAAERVSAQAELARHRNACLRRQLLAAAFGGRLTGRSADVNPAQEAICA
mgnify:FL=1